MLQTTESALLLTTTLHRCQQKIFNQYLTNIQILFFSIILSKIYITCFPVTTDGRVQFSSTSRCGSVGVSVCPPKIWSHLLHVNTKMFVDSPSIPRCILNVERRNYKINDGKMVKLFGRNFAAKLSDLLHVKYKI